MFVVSFLLSLILYPLALLTSLVVNIWNARFKKALLRFDNQLMDIAVSIDATGNTVCDDLFNLIMISKEGYQFGNRKETISSVLGKNQRDHTLIFCGILLSLILDTINKDHCKISIDEKV